MRTFHWATLALAFSTGLSFATPAAPPGPGWTPPGVVQDTPDSLPPCAWCTAAKKHPDPSAQLASNVLVIVQAHDGTCHLNHHVPADCVPTLGCRYIIQLTTVDLSAMPSGTLGEARLAGPKGDFFGTSFGVRQNLDCESSEAYEVNWGYVDVNLEWHDHPDFDSYSVELDCLGCQL